MQWQGWVARLQQLMYLVTRSERQTPCKTAEGVQRRAGRQFLANPQMAL